MQTRGERSLAEEVMAREDTIIRRWKTCLHEAGHAVAGRRLLNCTVKAVVFDSGKGAAYFDSDNVIPRTFLETLCIAAGPAAESLVDLHAPPASLPPPPLAVAYPEQAKPLMTQLRQSPPDAVRIARWCIGGIENQPERWSKRFHWVHREAHTFVARHQREIVEVAASLFSRGIVDLPAEPRVGAHVQ